MTSEQIAILIYKEMEGEQLNSSEAAELQRWKDENPEHTEFFDEESFSRLIKANHPDILKEREERIYNRLEKRIEFKVVPLYRRSFFRIAAAACIALLITVGGYFMFSNNKQGGEPPVARTEDIKPPQTNKAVIELPDGKLISLDTLTTYTQGSVTVTKTADGRLVYTGFGSEVRFNTLTNPRGSKVIDIELADKSHVWLNAGSSITYPISFAGNERGVRITGEAYFEVTPDKSKPFIVSRGITSVTVLGTHFNVNAYEDESDIKVTLLEGSVRVSAELKTITIKPNEQAIVEPNGSVSLNRNVDVAAVMAWKNGLFFFNGTDIKTVMRQIERWYDAEVDYEAPITERFGGSIPRDVSLSKVLKMLELTDHVHFKIEGKKITVMK